MSELEQKALTGRTWAPWAVVCSSLAPIRSNLTLHELFKTKSLNYYHITIMRLYKSHFAMQCTVTHDCNQGEGQLKHTVGSKCQT